MHAICSNPCTHTHTHTCTPQGRRREQGTPPREERASQHPTMPKRPLSPTVSDDEFISARYVTKRGQWRGVPTVNGVLVSSLGWIRRRDPKCGWTKAYQPKQECNGYRRFYHNGKNLSVHWCVCRTFHGAPSKGQTPDHVNRDRGDNRASNLRWSSRSAQQHNRKRPKTQCNSKQVLLWHPTDSYTPPQLVASTNIAGKLIGAAGVTIRQAMRTGCKARGYRVTLATPSESQDDLPGEQWLQVAPTLRVSSMGRVQTTTSGVWQYKRTALPLDGVGYAKVLTNRSFHDVMYRAFYPNTPAHLTIDHKNRNKSDNRLDNLRAVTWSVQNRNKGHSKHQRVY